MTYFMIVVILYGYGNVETKVPMDNYEHCMEMKEYVLDSLRNQLNHHAMRAACPPVQTKGINYDTQVQPR